MTGRLGVPTARHRRFRQRRMSDERPYCYAYPRPALTVDVALVCDAGSHIEVLLIQRGKDPFRGRWALPGGFVDMDEDLPDAAARELAEETGAQDVYLEQLGAYGRPDRDPRGRTVSVAYLGLCRRSDVRAAGGDDAAEAAWFAWTQTPPLAFDHDHILADARDRLALRLQQAPMARHLLPETFEPAALTALHRHVSGCTCTQDDLVARYVHRNWMASAGPGLFRFVAES